MSEAQPFVHLRVHSAYSLLEGALTISKLASLARDDGAPALALTDTNNLFGALELSEALAGAGIQPIIGMTLSLAFADRKESAGLGNGAEPNRPRADGRIALLAKDAQGYANLMRLSTDAYFAASETGEVVSAVADLAKRSDGLIALTGGLEGPLDLALADGNRELERSAVAEAGLQHVRDHEHDEHHRERDAVRHGTAAEDSHRSSFGEGLCS